MLQRRPSGLPLPRGARRRRRPRRRRGPRSAGQDAVRAPRRQGRRGRPVGGLRARQRRGHPHGRGRLPARPACGRLVQVSSPSVAHAGRSLVGVGAGPPTRRTPAGTTPAPRRSPSRRRWPPTAPTSRSWRSGRTWSGDPATPSWSARIVARARAGRLPGARLRRRAHRHHLRRQRRRRAGRRRRRLRAAHGEALVVSNGEPRPVAEVLRPAVRAPPACPRPRRRVPARRGPAGRRRRRGRLGGRPAGTDTPPLTRFLAEQLTTAHWFDQRRTREVLAWTPEVSLDGGLRAARAVVRSTAAGPVRLSVRRVAWPGDSERDPAPRRTS